MTHSPNRWAPLRNGIILLIVIRATFAQQLHPNSVGQSRVLQAHAIVITRLDTLGARGTCAPPNNGRGNGCRPATLRVDRILKDQDHQHLEPGLFRIEIPARDAEPASWGAWFLETGRQYVVLSNAQGGMATVLESPYFVSPIAQGEDPAADIEAILQAVAASRGVADQIAAASVRISSSNTPHSLLMAEYLLNLLDSCPDEDISQLVPAVEGRQGPIFSNDGAAQFLGNVLFPLEKRSVLPPNALRLFVAVMARSLDEQERQPTMRDARGDILGRFVPWVLRSEPAMSALRATLNPQTAAVFQKKVLELAKQETFPAAQRANLLRLAAVGRNE